MKRKINVFLVAVVLIVVMSVFGACEGEGENEYSQGISSSTILLITDKDNQQEIEVKNNSNFKLSIPEDREYYTFKGWYVCQGEGGWEGDFYHSDSEDGFSSFYERLFGYVDLTIFAKWQRIQFIVQFDDNNADIWQKDDIDYLDSLQSRSFVYNKGEKALNMDSIPQKRGFDFMGWHSGEDMYDFDSEIFSDISLTAKWRHKTEYTEGLSFEFLEKQFFYDDYGNQVGYAGDYYRVVNYDMERAEGEVVIPAFYDDGENGLKDVRSLLGAFNGNQNISKLYIPATVDTIFACFSHTSIEEFIVDELNIGYASIDGNLIYKPLNALEVYVNMGGRVEYSIPDGVERIGEGAFNNNNVIKKVTFSSTVKSIREGAFVNCGELEEVVLNKGLEVIGQNAFWQCQNISSIIIPYTVKDYQRHCFAYWTEQQTICFEDEQAMVIFNTRIYNNQSWQTLNDANVVYNYCE